MAGGFVDNPSLFGGFVSGAVDNAVASITGGVVSNVTQQVPGALGNPANFSRGVS